MGTVPFAEIEFGTRQGSLDRPFQGEAAAQGDVGRRAGEAMRLAVGFGAVQGVAEVAAVKSVGKGLKPGRDNRSPLRGGQPVIRGLNGSVDKIFDEVRRVIGACT